MISDREKAQLLVADRDLVQWILEGVTRFEHVRRQLMQIQQELGPCPAGSALLRESLLRLGLTRVLLEIDRLEQPTQSSRN